MGTLAPIIVYVLCGLQVDKREDPTKVAASRVKDLTLQRIRQIREAPSDTAKRHMRVECGLKEVDNPMLMLSLDLYQ